MRTKEVDIWVGYDQPPRKERIPILDGYRGNPSTMSWRDEATGTHGQAYGDAAYALERDLFELMRGFTVALYPFAELLKELDNDDDPVKRATGLAYNRYVYSHNWVEAAQELSSRVPRYRELLTALKALGATLSMHAYTPDTVNVVKDGYCDSCIHLNEDGTYDAGWSDGYHVNNEGEKRTAAEVAIRAIEIAKEQQQDGGE